MIRTSNSHPLKIASVRADEAVGRIGITFCPGKKQLHAASGSWVRDLDLDLDSVRDWGASAVVTLVEDHELKELAVDRLGEAVRDRHMAWYHLPIRDVSVPDSAFEAKWAQQGQELRALLARGFNIVVHCKGGLGRAGTIAAKLLAELGDEPKQAISKVRQARPGAIETHAQEQYVLSTQHLPILQCCKGQSPADRLVGAMVGLAVGDAVGTTLEFKSRDSYPILTDMVGGGPFNLEPGQWTDDTAMALALAASIIENGKLDQGDLMDKFASWRDQGRFSCTGKCFDIGITTSSAIDRYLKTGDPKAGSTSPNTAGNGSLMRLAPVVLAFAKDRAALAQAAREQSSTTHGAPAAVSACAEFALLIADVCDGDDLDAALSKLESRAGSIEAPEIAAIAAGSWRGKQRQQIRSSGYVVHSLEAAIWCVATTRSFENAVLRAANLGEDADTTAAITGQLAGAVYGLSGIPHRWLEMLSWRDEIIHQANALIELSTLVQGDQA